MRFVLVFFPIKIVELFPFPFVDSLLQYFTLFIKLFYIISPQISLETIKTSIRRSTKILNKLSSFFTRHTKHNKSIKFPSPLQIWIGEEILNRNFGQWRRLYFTTTKMSISTKSLSSKFPIHANKKEEDENWINNREECSSLAMWKWKTDFLIFILEWLYWLACLSNALLCQYFCLKMFKNIYAAFYYIYQEI